MDVDVEPKKEPKEEEREESFGLFVVGTLESQIIKHNANELQSDDEEDGMREGGKNNPIALVSILILSPNKLTGSRTMIEGSQSRFIRHPISIFEPDIICDMGRYEIGTVESDLRSWRRKFEECDSI